ncbi:metal-dependent phosphohydrolase [Halobacteriales archaeon QS_3_64_16]|nr:MAG: metal-dependent phosphohydrolase [Halobacteriales archaeon QS_3_64_16]
MDDQDCHDYRETVATAFPELICIESDALREGVLDAWSKAMAENGLTDLDSLPWFPPAQRNLDLPDEYLVPHVRDVTRGALALAETLTERRDLDISLDTLLAGALLHDISKLYEFDGTEPTEIENLLGHPHYGVAVVAATGLGPEIAHVVLSHTRRTAIEPATIEAELVHRADEAAAAAIRAQALDDLREG